MLFSDFFKKISPISLPLFLNSAQKKTSVNSLSQEITEISLKSPIYFRLGKFFYDSKVLLERNLMIPCLFLYVCLLFFNEFLKLHLSLLHVNLRGVDRDNMSYNAFYKLIFC